MIRCALTGFGIILICVLIPLVHFVSGPLAPLIGGWFAGNKLGANTTQSVILGISMGLLMIIPLSGILLVNITYDTLIPLDNQSIKNISLVILIYISILGSLGSILGGRMSNNS